jgi:hypothetical protein
MMCLISPQNEGEGVFTCLVRLENYDHAHLVRLEKLSRLELSRSPNGHRILNKKLLGPGGGFASETVARRLQKRNAKRPLRNRFRSETVTNLAL